MKLSKIDYFYILSIIVVLIISIAMKDSIFAIISSVFGIIYTILIGKGKPVGYVFGMIGTISGSILAYIIALWGNFILHAFFFFPMEIIGLISWNKNLNKEKDSVIKEKLKTKELVLVVLISVIIFAILSYFFKNTQDIFPYIDAFITTLSLTGMYLTVRRCYEQWIIWTIVNITSVLMWFEVYASGYGVISVLIVRMIYLILGIYFLVVWAKEIKNTK